MAQGMSPAFSFQVGACSAESLGVRGFSGTEGLGRLFEFQVEFFPKDGNSLEPANVVGKDALLAVAVRDGTTRHVHGWTRGLESLGVISGRRRYRVSVVPKLWRLTQSHRSRIFQGKSVPDILKAVLDEAGVDFRLALSGSYAPREYCVQYRESDFALLSRLMEWEGIFYFFEHAEDSHTLVVADAPAVHAPLPGGASLPLRAEDGHAVDGEYVRTLEVVQRLRPGAVHLKDFDFEKPALDVSGKSQAPEGLHALEIYDYPAGFVAPGVGKATAKSRQEALNVGGHTLAGESIAPRLTTGYLLEVKSPEDGTFAGEYLVTEVVHSGSQPDVSPGSESLQGLYRNHFQLLPKGVPFRPRRQTPLPVIPGLHTATVVGPAGEEIHTDAHGRVKVHFHWDREGQRNDKDSCWVRVGQPWGGTAWGALWLPRIGQEVLVRFLEGDPDRPLIAGAVYNGANATPYALPDEKTKSTRKSASSIGSNGFNEVRIEDLAREEEIFTHAQKDEDLLTENDKAQEVRGYEELLVKKDRKRTVEGDQTLAVKRDDVGVVEGNQTLLVQGHRDTTVQGDHSESVEGNQAMTVGKARTALVSQATFENVGAAKAVTVGAGYMVNVALAFNEAVGGVKSSEVGAAHFEYVKGSRQEMVGKDREAKVAGTFQLEVKGRVTLTVGKDLKDDVGTKMEVGVKEAAAWLAKQFSLSADTFNLIVNDKLILKMEKSGNVTLAPKTLTLEGSDIKMKGAKVKLEPAGAMKDKSAKLQAIDSAVSVAPQNLEFQVKGPDGKGIPDREFEVTLADGTVKKGKTDSGGAVKMEKVPAGQYKVSFPE